MELLPINRSATVIRYLLFWNLWVGEVVRQGICCCFLSLVEHDENEGIILNYVG